MRSVVNCEQPVALSTVVVFEAKRVNLRRCAQWNHEEAKSEREDVRH